MIFFFQGNEKVYGVLAEKALSHQDTEKLRWLLGNADKCSLQSLHQTYIGPRREMITPWSTNAVEITQNMGISGIQRIEEFVPAPDNPEYDPMLQTLYPGLDQTIFHIDRQPEPVQYIDDIAAYNQIEGLALSQEEIEYLTEVSEKLGRSLTDSEIFGFSQVNSEHCRHKIFNGQFIIDGKEMPETLFGMIKKTSYENPNYIISAYKDNVAFIDGCEIQEFSPRTQDKSDFFSLRPVDAVISLKAETHNFPTTVEPFNGAATGSGGEIRDRMAGGTGSLPLAGTAVYMTSYPRQQAVLDENKIPAARKWLYHSPLEILIKASNGASDFGNKFGQPLICGSVFTFEHQEKGKIYGFDKVVMLAGGVGYGHKNHSHKQIPVAGDKVVVLGGDNYRIGMGGGAVSSVATGEFHNAIELNAVQRSNPEMQKRVYNAIRAMVESEQNPIVSIHDHGAGGHLNSLSELAEATGAFIDIEKLPVGDPTLSAREIIGNESQERMGLIMNEKDLDLLKAVSERERAPMYVVGNITGDMQFTFADKKGNKPLDLPLEYLFGKPPRTILTDSSVTNGFKKLTYSTSHLHDYLERLLQLEAVGCKDWLTNKVDRSVTGRIAMQQCSGPLQLPLNNLGIVALDYTGKKGIATSIGHNPAAALVNAGAGSRLAITEALTNLIWAPLTQGLKGVSLSANWMWPAKNPGENARLYEAVKAAADFAIELGINIPTGKDSLSMTQKYPDGTVVYSPGTVIISAVAQVNDFTQAVTPVIAPRVDSSLLYINFSSDECNLGGSSFAQLIGLLGDSVPDVLDAERVKNAFSAVQRLIKEEKILAGHDIGSGGLITSLLEMCFAYPGWGMQLDFSVFEEPDLLKILFSENPGVVIQICNCELETVENTLADFQVPFYRIGNPVKKETIQLQFFQQSHEFDIPSLRDLWYSPSFLFDCYQSGEILALERYKKYKMHPLDYRFPENFDGSLKSRRIQKIHSAVNKAKAAIIREKGVNGDREMAYALYLAGFEVKDVHMTDLSSGRETLEDVNMIVFVGGFSNSDVLGSAKGWAGAFLFNEKAKTALDRFYSRPDTLSLGICNGCQLMIELGLVTPEHEIKPRMLHNDSKKFESGFVLVDIPDNNSIMLSALAGSRLGVWVAHGEGKFDLPYDESAYCIPATYSFDVYPHNPNGSEYAAAALCSADGRHLVMMPHIERAFYPWQWPWYPKERNKDEVSPWLDAFIAARKWVEKH